MGCNSSQCLFFFEAQTIPLGRWELLLASMYCRPVTTAFESFLHLEWQDVPGSSCTFSAPDWKSVYFGEKWYFKATALGRLMTMSWSLFLGFFCGQSCNVFKAIPREVILRLPIQSKGFTAPFLHDICISFLPCLILKNTGEDRMKICPKCRLLYCTHRTRVWVTAQTTGVTGNSRNVPLHRLFSVSPHFYTISVQLWTPHCLLFLLSTGSLSFATSPVVILTHFWSDPPAVWLPEACSPGESPGGAVGQ